MHSNATLSETDKFHYLRNYLRGEAAAAIAGFATTSACYGNAVQLLKDRYGDKRQIEQHRLRALRDIRCVRLASDVQQLRNLYDQVQMNMRGLDALGVPTSSFSAMLYDILLKALPQEIVISFHRQRRISEVMLRTSVATNEETVSSCQDLESLLQFTRIEIESRERSGTQESSERTHNCKHIPSASVLHTAHTGKPKYGECFFCKSMRHETEVCDSSLTLEEKKDRLGRSMRCYKCTIPGHLARDCRRRIQCLSCKKRHATTMCNPNANEKSTRKLNTTTACVNETQSDQNERSTAVTSCQLDEGVHLQTFRSWVGREDKACYIRGILDSGSQRSFIKEELATRLQLTSNRRNEAGNQHVCV